MSREPTRDAPSLSRALASITLPLLVLVFVLVSLSAPVAVFVIRRAGLRASAHAVARDVAVLVGREAEDRPVLWRYDAPKLLEHARAYEQRPEVAAIAVVDTSGTRVDSGHDVGADDEARVWASEPIVAQGTRIGAAWVAAPVAGARRDASLLLAPFAALGCLLAVLLYWLPSRALRRAEARLATAQHARDASARAIALQEDERRAIARDLHDTAGQALTALRIQLELLRSRAEPADAVRATAERAIDATDVAIEEFRRALARLAPAVLDEVGLVGAIARACDDLADRLSILVRRELPSARVELDGSVETACYRIAQEALTNVARHANAKTVDVVLEVHEHELVLEVRDDGRGLDPSSSRDPPTRGLSGMRERVELLGGKLELRSAPGSGTTVRATLPRTPAPAAPSETS